MEDGVRRMISQDFNLATNLINGLKISSELVDSDISKKIGLMNDTIREQVISTDRRPIIYRLPS